MLAVPAPLLVVVDWADTHAQRAVDLAQRAATAAAGPVRLLLARRAGTWWDTLPYRAGDLAGEVFAAAAVTDLGPLATDPAARREQYRAAVGAFAARLGRDGTGVPDPDLSAAIFETVLLVHLKALVDVDTPAGARVAVPGAGAAVPGAGALLDELLRREDIAYWDATAPPALRGEYSTTTRQRALAVATLTAASTEDDARSALRTLPDFDGADPTPGLYWLRSLYPGGAFLGPLRPDLLGEALIAQVVRDRPDLPLRLLPDSGATWATRLLTILGQAAGSHPDLLATLAGLLDARMPVLVAQARAGTDADLGHALALGLTRAASVDLARAFHGLLPEERSLALGEAAVAGYQVLLDHDPGAEQLPYLHGNLAVWLGELGRDTEALAASERAVAAQRELARDGDPDRRWVLAIALSNLASALRAAGQAERGVAAADEALAILGGSAGSVGGSAGSVGGSAAGAAPVDSALLARATAAALTNRSDCLAVLGRDREAYDSMERAVEIMRRLARADGTYRPELARALENWSGTLARWRRRGEALAAIDEAVEVAREMAGANPDGYRADLARALHNASQTYLQWNSPAEALALAEEAEPLCRRLATARPERYRPWLARFLDGKADALSLLERFAEAAPVRAEVVDTYRGLVDEDPGAYRSGLTQALTDQADCLYRLGRLEEAVAALGEAAAVGDGAPGGVAGGRMPGPGPAAGVAGGRMPGPGPAGGRMPDAAVAAALQTRNRLLDELGRPDEAIKAAAEAARVYRDLVAVRPEAFHADLTATLTARAVLLAAAGRMAEAMADIDEATALPRELSEAQPRAFWALVGALGQKAEFLAAAGDTEGAEAAEREAGMLPMPVGMEIVIPDVGVAEED